jgi:hypothetical protein
MNFQDQLDIVLEDMEDTFKSKTKLLEETKLANVFFNILMEGLELSGDAMKNAIQGAITPRGGENPSIIQRYNLDGDYITHAIASYLQHYNMQPDLNQIYRALYAAVELIWGPTGRVSNQVRFHEKPQIDTIYKAAKKVFKLTGQQIRSLEPSSLERRAQDTEDHERDDDIINSITH